ncbi:hypothetical protein [Streptomyces sp. G45]|uniref:hypothetical protein n=1 Tax=Streptomyces sp. G45 TaxID=3406627 RepID=UPI003C14BE29
MTGGPREGSGALRRAAGRLRAARRGRAAERELHRRLRQQLQELGVQPPLRIEDLCRALARRRGRRIVLRPLPLPTPGPQGLWVETPGLDLVVYQQHTSPMHQEHITLHEVMGHICGDHRPDPAAQWDLAVPGLGPQAVRRVTGLARCSYDDPSECEAERAADIVSAWRYVLDSVATAAPADPELRAVQLAFGDRQGWL